MRKAQDASQDIPVDPKQTVLVLLRLKLGRAPSVAALAAIEALSEPQLTTLREALERPKAEGLRLAQAMLSTDL